MAIDRTHDQRKEIFQRWSDRFHPGGLRRRIQGSETSHAVYETLWRVGSPSQFQALFGMIDDKDLADTCAGCSFNPGCNVMRPVRTCSPRSRWRKVGWHKSDGFVSWDLKVVCSLVVGRRRF